MTEKTVQHAIDYIQETHNQILEDYKKLLRSPSIDGDPAYTLDVNGM